MRNQTKQLLFSLLSLIGVVALLLWVFGDVSLTDVVGILLQANLGWVAVALIINIASFWIRAYRWCLLLRGAGSSLSVEQSFWALMAGYLASFAIPRIGDIFRCTMLKKMHNIALFRGLGTVTSERLIDIATMLVVVGISCLLQYEWLSNQLKNSLQGTHIASHYLLYLLFIGIGAGVVVLLLGVYKKKIHQRWISTWHLFWSGLLSIRNLRPRYAFLGSTILLWLFYYLSNYAFMQAYSATSDLPAQAGILLLATSSLAMLVPLQGGIGSFHAFTQATLVFYGVHKVHALATVTAIHLGYMLWVGLFGGYALFLLFRKTQKA